MAARRDRVELADLKRAVLLSDLVQRFGVKLVRHGNRYRGLCPFHNEKTPSFDVNDMLGVYYCHGCAAGGDVVTWLMNSEGMTFPEAKARLCGTAVPDVVEWHRRHDAQQAELRATSMGHWTSARPLEGSVVGNWLRYAFGIEGAFHEAVRWDDLQWILMHGNRNYRESCPPLVAKVDDDNGMTTTYGAWEHATVGAPGRAAVRYGGTRPLIALTVSLVAAMWISGRFGVPCWAALSSKRLGKVAIPDGVGEMVIFAADEEWGRACDAADRHETGQRTVTLERLGNHIYGGSTQVPAT